MSNKKIRGLSLVELMVAMVLGLLITAGVTQLFLTNRLTSNLQQGLASVQEQGRFAVDFLSRELMSAGYGNVDRAIYFPIDAQDEEASSSDGTLFDSVMIFLEDGEDCSGGVINEATSEDFEPVENPYKYYEVNTSDDGINTLVCKDSDGSPANVLVDNVEAFQVLFGIADGDDQFATRYVSASNVSSGDKVVSIRYGIMIASDSVAVAAAERSDARVIARLLDQAITNGTDTNQIDFADGRLRRVFVSTIGLRNVATE
ncbi:MAG: PilW family protein [Pseudomonadales bacterium]|nr:PilW family protein [Pseudomonadales bacterium]